MKATLSLTHRCNLACTYCYSGNPRNENMALETACKAVDLVMDLGPGGEVIDFCFFGGEPLLCFDLLKDIALYISEQSSRRQRAVRLNVTTNGTMLDDAVLDFLKLRGVYLCVSIDGRQSIHDRHRRYRNGRSTFCDVVSNLHRALHQLDRVQVNAVYGPDTVDRLADSVAFLSDLGVRVIHVNLDICACWTKSVWDRFEESYAKVADYYITSYEEGRELAVNLIDSKVILLLKGGYSQEDVCGMAESEWGFAPSGNIYPCERLVGEDNDSSLCLGNVYTGLDSVRRCAVIAGKGNRNEECAHCTLRPYCMNWCGCTNYYTTGQTSLAAPVLCASERGAIQAAKHVLTTLSDNELFVDHLMRYLHESQPWRN